MNVEGWASRPTIDHVLDLVLPSAFDRSIRERGINGPRGIKLLAQHDREKPIGVITKLETSREGLWLEADIDEGISYAADLAKAIKANGGLSYSIGYRIEPGGIEFIENSPRGPHFLVKQVDLFEISVVTFPCNEDCYLLLPKSTEQRLADSIAAMKALAAPTDPYAAISASLAQLKGTFR